MNMSLLPKHLLLAVGIIAFWSVAMPAFAEDDISASDLQRLVAIQQKQLQAQQQQLDAQNRMLLDLQAQMQSLVAAANRPAVTVAEKPATPTGETRAVTIAANQAGTIARTQSITVAGTPPANPAAEPDGAPPRSSNALTDEARHDQKNPTGANVQYSKAAVSITEPKTGTEIGIHGFAQLQAIHDTTGLNNNEFDTIGIPVNGAPAQTKFSVNPSRLGISSKTPLSFGRINTLVSIDFNGKLDSPDPRLREAYGEFINDDLDFALLAGQTYGTMLDLKSVPETLDFAGPTGYFARRQPVARFSKLINHKVMVDIAAETPENVGYIDAGIRTGFPDFVAAAGWDVGGEVVDHVRVAGIVRDLRAEGTTGPRAGSTASALGWAIGGTGKLNLPIFGDKDNFKFGVQYGMGYGAQLKSGPPDAAFNPATSSLSTIGVFSAYAGLQHWWSDKIRSNVVVGHVEADNPKFVAGDELKNTSYFAADIIWNPFEQVNIGFEYLWGRRENKNGASGIANRFLLSSKFDF